MWIILILQNRGDLYLELLTSEEETDKFSRNVGYCISTLRNIPEERRSQWHLGRSL